MFKSVVVLNVDKVGIVGRQRMFSHARKNSIRKANTVIILPSLYFRYILLHIAGKEILPPVLVNVVNDPPEKTFIAVEVVDIDLIAYCTVRRKGTYD